MLTFAGLSMAETGDEDETLFLSAVKKREGGMMPAAARVRKR